MQTTYEICKALVECKLFSDTDLALKFDVFFGRGRITLDEYMGLMDLIESQTPPDPPVEGTPAQ